MSIKATQPEDSAVAAFLCTSKSGLSRWTVMPNVMTPIVREVFERDGVTIEPLALATPSPQPAEAKTAAVDGMTDEQIYVWWASENGLEDCDMCKRNDFLAVVRAVEKKLAAIATQEGGAK